MVKKEEPYFPGIASREAADAKKEYLQREKYERDKNIADYYKKRTSQGRVARGFQKGFSLLRRGGVTRATYGNQIAPQGTYPTRKTIKGVNKGRGRPVGTKDVRYAAYGGVYGYRKAMAQRRFLERQQALRNAAVNPQQQAILAQIEARRRAQAMNPEGRTIADTNGDVYLGDIMREIDDASNLFR